MAAALGPLACQPSAQLAIGPESVLTNLTHGRSTRPPGPILAAALGPEIVLT